MKTMKQVYAFAKHFSIKKNLCLSIFSLIIIMLLSAQKIAAQTVSLGNTVWWDFNNNGKKDGADFGSNGFTVSLYQDNNNDGVADAGFTTLTSTTNSQGQYLFTNLAPGSYFVRLSAGGSHFKGTVYGGDPDNNIDGDNNGYFQDLSTMYIYSQTITLSAGAEPDGSGATNTNTNNTLDFNIWKGNGLGDMVWLDNNGNGIQENGEPGIPNVTVKLKNNSGTVLETTTTDSKGEYYFFNPIQYGGITDYQVEFVTPAGYTSTNSNMGSDDALDSDPVNGIITGINVPFGQWNKSFDAGFKPLSALPVNLLSFFANLNNDKVNLNWVTSSEINVSHFVIERSTDGTNFGAAAIVLANGNAAGKANYSLADDISNIPAKVIYYRLRSVDANGKSQYSETLVVRLVKQQSNTINIYTYPNPVINELRITLPANWQNKNVKYEVLNTNGQVAKQAEKANSNQTETLNIQNIASGFYIVRVSCEGQTAQQKIIKL